MIRNLLSSILLITAFTSFAQTADTGYKAVVDFRPAVGALGVFGGRFQCLILDLQVISSQKFWILKPMGGVIANAYGDVYIYAGINIPFKLASFLELGVSLAPGLYFTDQGVDLGSPLEFRTTVNLNYVFPKKIAIGVEFSHISNAGIGYQNPGIETLSIYFRFPTIFSRKTKNSP